MRRNEFVAVLAFSLAACGGDDEDVAISPADAPSSVVIEGPGGEQVTVEPVHGGTVVAAGPHALEVARGPEGEVDAWFVGPNPPPPGASVTVRVPTAEGPRPTMLTWDPQVEAYRGRVHNVELVPGPAPVTVVVEGSRYEARAPRLVVLEHPPRPAATVVVEADAPRGPDVVVEAPRPRGPTVVVEHPDPRPRVDVRVEAPPPPQVNVRVEGPRPPGHRVRVRGHHPPGHRVRGRRGRVRVGHPGGGRGHARKGRGRGRGRRGVRGGRVRVRR